MQIMIIFSLILRGPGALNLGEERKFAMGTYFGASRNLTHNLLKCVTFSYILLWAQNI